MLSFHRFMDTIWSKRWCIYLWSGRDKCTFMQEKMGQFLSPPGSYQSDLSSYSRRAPSLHLSPDPPRVSFSTSSGLWPFSNTPRSVWPDRGRFQKGPDSDETPPEVRELQLKHTVARVLTVSTCVSPCLRGSKSGATDKGPFDV